MSYLGLTVSSFALEAKEECTGHENPAFYSSEEPTIKEVLIVRLRTSLHTSFGFLTYWISMLYRKSLQNSSSLHSAVILNHYIACLHIFFIEAKSYWSFANSLILGHEWHWNWGQFCGLQEFIENK